MADTTTEIRIETRPYKPSWVDRFTDWVERLPTREWVFYVGLGLVLILVQMLFLWLDGGLQFDALLPVILFNALAIPYSLALIHLLDNQAVTALNSMRPTLAITEPEFDDLQYKLSTRASGRLPTRLTCRYAAQRNSGRVVPPEPFDFTPFRSGQAPSKGIALSGAASI